MCAVAGIIKVGGRVVVVGVVARKCCRRVRIFLEVVFGICGGWRDLWLTLCDLLQYL